MGIEGLDDPAKQFLTALFDLTEGSPSRQVSMYKIGESLGMDRDEAAKTAELLIGNNLAEIKTLSGGIGITETAVAALKACADDAQTQANKVSALTQAPVIDASGKHSIDVAVTNIKHHINALGLDFDAVASIIADIKTIEAQLASPTPKTAIIRECFVSINSFVGKTKHDLIKEQTKSILAS